MTFDDHDLMHASHLAMACARQGLNLHLFHGPDWKVRVSREGAGPNESERSRTVIYDSRDHPGVTYCNACAEAESRVLLQVPQRPTPRDETSHG